jgi:hypothetical protein
MEDPRMNEQMNQVRAAMERIRSGASSQEEVELPGAGRARIIRDEEVPSGIRVEMPGRDEKAEESEGTAGRSENPDPDRRLMMDQVKAASQRVRAGESEEEILTLSGGDTVRITRDPEIDGAYAVESLRGENRFLARTLEGREECPEGYPRDLPFVPGATVSISAVTPADESQAPRTVAWMNPPDVDEALEVIRRELQAGGWEEGEKSVGSTLHGPTINRTYAKGELTRQLMIMAFGPMSQILMLEKGAEGS